MENTKYETQKDMTTERTSVPTVKGGTAKNKGNPKKSYDKRLQPKISPELRLLLIKAVLAIFERYNKYYRGMNKEHTEGEFKNYLNLTPYSSFHNSDEKINMSVEDSTLIRAATSCLYMSYEVMGDEMHSNLFGRDLCELERQCQSYVEGILPEDCDFDVVVSDSANGFTQTHYNYLKKLFPNIKQDGRLVKRAISDTILLASRISGKFNAHLCSAGSKIQAMRMFH